MKLTRRGKRVRAVAILLALTAIFYTATHLHYTEEGYCWGSFTKCYEGEGE